MADSKLVTDPALIRRLETLHGYASDPFYNALVGVESNYNASAVGPVTRKGTAVGMGQTLPSTLLDPGYGVTPARDNSPEEMARVGRDYSQAMLQKYGGDRELAAMAYNWGPGNVDNWVRSGRTGQVPQETVDYVAKVNARLAGKPADQTGGLITDPDLVTKLETEYERQTATGFWRQAGRGAVGALSGTNPETVGYFLEGVGTITGLDDVKKAGADLAMFGAEQAGGYQPRVSSWRDVMSDEGIMASLRNARDYAGYMIGSGVGSMAPSIAAGAAGAALTGGPWGAAIAAIGPSYMQNSGELLRDLKRELADTPVNENDVALAAFAAGVPISALDLFSLGKATAPFKRELTTRFVKAAAKEIAAGAGIEGLTEALQQTINEVTSVYMGGDPDTMARVDQVIDAGLGGFLTGGAVRGVAIAARQQPAQTAAQPAAQPSGAPAPAQPQPTAPAAPAPPAAGPQASPGAPSPPPGAPPAGPSYQPPPVGGPVAGGPPPLVGGQFPLPPRYWQTPHISEVPEWKAPGGEHFEQSPATGPVDGGPPAPGGGKFPTPPRYWQTPSIAEEGGPPPSDAASPVGPAGPGPGGGPTPVQQPSITGPSPSPQIGAAMEQTVKAPRRWRPTEVRSFAAPVAPVAQRAGYRLMTDIADDGGLTISLVAKKGAGDAGIVLDAVAKYAKPGAGGVYRLKDGRSVTVTVKPYVARVAGRPRRPLDLVELLAFEGGIQDSDGEISAIVGKTRAALVPAAGNLIRKGGMTMDEAIGRLDELGYFADRKAGEAGSTYAEKVTKQDFLDALRDTIAARANPQQWGHLRRFSGKDRSEVDAKRDEIVGEDIAARNAEALAEATAQVKAAAEEHNFRASDDAIRAATRAVMERGVDPAEALYDAIEAEGRRDESSTDADETGEPPDWATADIPFDEKDIPDGDETAAGEGGPSTPDREEIPRDGDEAERPVAGNKDAAASERARPGAAGEGAGEGKGAGSQQRPSADTPEARIKAAGLTVTGGNGIWHVGGKTFEKKDILKGLGGGRWDAGKKAWRFQYDPTNVLARALDPIEEPADAAADDFDDLTAGGLAPPPAIDMDDDDLAGFREGEAPYGPKDVITTGQLLERGAAAGIPPGVIANQKEDAARIYKAWRDKKPAYMLASEPGSGKTFVLGAAIREMRRKGQKRFIYVTMNQRLIKQIKRDLADFDLTGVEFSTYSMLTKPATVPKVQSGDVLIFDESHNVKNFKGAKMGAAAQRMMKAADGFTVFSSATPFENPIESEYTAASGLWKKAGISFWNWAKQHGARERKVGQNTFLEWSGNKNAAKRANQWFIDQGIYTYRPMHLPEGMVSSEFYKLDADKDFTDLYDQVENTFADAVEAALEGKHKFQIRGYRANLLKRILEASKTAKAGERAKAHLARGRRVVIFSETKAERHIGRFPMRDAGPDSQLYTYPEIREMMDEWRREAAVARRSRAPVPPSPFAQFIEIIAEHMHRHGIDRALPRTLDTIADDVGRDKVAFYTGYETDKQAEASLDEWFSGRKPVLIATMAKGGTGLSLHDKVGDAPRSQIGLNLPWKASSVNQTAGRTARYGMKSKTEIEWLVADNIAFERNVLAPRVAKRMHDLGAVVKGQDVKEAQDLDDWDFQAAEGEEIYPPGGAQPSPKTRKADTWDDYLPESIAVIAAASDPHAGAGQFVTERGKEAGHEYLVLLDRDGAPMVAGTTNRSNTVTFTPEIWQRLIGSPDAGIAGHHNHPSSRPLSPDDLGLLATLGMTEIWAHGHDGGSYGAKLTERGRAMFVERSRQGKDARIDGGLLANALKTVEDRVVRATALTNAVRGGKMTIAQANTIFMSAEVVARARLGIFQLRTTNDLASLNGDPYFDELVRELTSGYRSLLGATFDIKDFPATELEINGDPWTIRPARSVGTISQGASASAPARSVPAVGDRASAADDQIQPRLVSGREPSREELAARQRKIDKERAEAAMAGRKVSPKGKKQEDFEDTALFNQGKQRQGSLFEGEAPYSAPPFFSALTRAVENVKQPKAPAAQWASIIRNLPGVKPEEIAWSGVEAWLADRKGPVSKDDLLAFLRANEVRVEEVVKDSEETKYGYDEKLTLPGGENYRELLLTLPEPAATERLPPEWRIETDPLGGYRVIGETEQIGWGATPEIAAERALREQKVPSTAFRGGHFDEPNVLAHVRFNERVDADGKRVLFVEEMQSDWHREGRKKGYKVVDEAAAQKEEQAAWRAALPYLKRLDFLGFDNVTDAMKALRQANDPDFDGRWDLLGEPEALAVFRRYADAHAARYAAQHGAPDAPFKTSWQELTFKRMLRWAAENGFDRLAWITGAQTQDRYDLSKQVEAIRVSGEGDDAFTISAKRKGAGGFDALAYRVSAEKLPDHVGKDLAEKIVADKIGLGGQQTYSGLDLKVGGEWAVNLYDKAIVNFAKKYGKKWGATVGTATIYPDGNQRFPWFVVDAQGHVRSSHETKQEADEEAARFGNEVRQAATPVHSIDITPAMRESVMAGQPLFKRGWGAAIFTPKAKERLGDIAMEIGEIVARIGPKGAKAKITTSPSPGEAAVYDADKNLIIVALGEPQDWRQTIRHELIHALRTYGLFTDAEWSTLTERARETWIDRYRIRGRYGYLAEDALVEEAIAEAFSEYATGRTVAPPGIHRLLERVREFFRAVKNWLRGKGFQTLGDVFTDADAALFAAVERGDVGKRDRQSAVASGQRIFYRRTRAQTVPQANLATHLTQAEIDALGDMGDKIGAPDQSILDRARGFVADVVPPGATPDMVDLATVRLSDRFKQSAIDKMHGIARLEKAVNQGVFFDDARSAYKLARLTAGTNDIVVEALMSGAPFWSEGAVAIDTSVRAPMQILERLGNRAREFEKYMAGRRASELAAQGKERLFTDEEIAAALKLADVYPDFAGLFEDLQTWNRRLLDFAEASGLLAGRTKALFLEMHQNYVPFWRVMEGDNTGPNARLGFAGQHPNFWRIKGSMRNVRDLFSNLERNAHRLIEASVKNEVMLRSERLNSAADNLFMTPVPAAAQQVLVNTGQMIRDLEAQGITIDPDQLADIDRNALRVLWSMGNRPKGDRIVSWVREGKVRYGDVSDPLLFRSLTQLSARQQMAFRRVIWPLRAAKNLLTAAIGLDPSYQAANFVRDNLHAGVITHVGFKPFIDGIRGLRSRFTSDAAWHEFLAAGGGMSALFETEGIGRGEVMLRRIEKMSGRKRPPGTKLVQTAEDMVGMLQHFESSFEYSTRIGAFRKLRGQGKTLLEAAYQAREISTDFGQRGDSALLGFFLDTVAFLNAGIQSLYRTYQGAGNPLGLVTGRGRRARGAEGVQQAQRDFMRFVMKGSILAAMSLAVWLRWKDDERYKELPDYMKDMYWHWWIEGTHYTIPKPFEVGAIFGTIPERAAQLAIEGNGIEFADRMQWLVGNMFRFDLVPAALRPPLRVYSNYDEFRDRTIIPGWMSEGRLPEDQYDANTPLSAIGAGRQLGVSPKNVETLLTGYLGSQGSYIMASADFILRTIGDFPPAPATRWYEFPPLNRFVRTPIPNTTQYVEQFYEMRDAAERLHGSVQARLAAGEADRAVALIKENPKLYALRGAINQIGQQIARVNNTLRAVKMNDTMDGEQKRRLLDQLTAARNRLAKSADALHQMVER